MRGKIYRVFIALVMLGDRGLVNAGIAVIVNPGSPTDDLSINEVRRLFLGKLPLNRDLNLLPINQPETSKVRANFEMQVLGKSPRQLRSYWIEKIFTGKGVPPKEFESGKAVIRYVSEHIDAIGYIDESQLVNKVKSVLIIP